MNNKMKAVNQNETKSKTQLLMTRRWVLSFCLAAGLLLGFISNAEAARSVASVTVGPQTGSLTYGTPATATFTATVSITGTGQPPSVTLTATPIISGVTYDWYDATTRRSLRGR